MQQYTTLDYIRLHSLMASSNSLSLLVEVPAFTYFAASNPLISNNASRSDAYGLSMIRDIIKLSLCMNPMPINTLANHDGHNTFSPCNVCESCVLFESETNPDVYYLGSSQFNYNESSASEVQITIDQIRDMLNFVNLSSHFSHTKVVVINRIEDCNLNGTNALLKVLEEPPHKVKFILLTNNLGKILPTIISRCYRYRFTQSGSFTSVMSLDLLLSQLTKEQKEQVLSTLTTPSFLNITQLTKFLDGKSIKFSVFLNIILHWIADLICVNSNVAPQIFIQYVDKLKVLNRRVQKDKLFILQDQIAFYSGWENHPLNYKLQIEAILLQYQQIFL